MMIDIEERYAGEEEADDPEAEWAMSGDEVTPPRGVFLIADLDGQPVGCGALRSLPPAGARVAEIKRMYAAPAARRRGVSRAVLAGSSPRRSGLGTDGKLETGLCQPEAMALYESSGYHRTLNYGMYAASELSACFAKDIRSK